MFISVTLRESKATVSRTKGMKFKGREIWVDYMSKRKLDKLKEILFNMGIESLHSPEYQRKEEFEREVRRINIKVKTLYCSLAH